MGDVRRIAASALGTVVLFATAGCANPGPPKPPSLKLPAPVRNLSASRQGAAVFLRFSVPERTTDGQILQTATLSVRVCRAVGKGPCRLLGAPEPLRAAAKTVAELRDVLPGDLSHGSFQLLSYQVEILNNQGRGAGSSDSAYAASGAAPEQVTDLSAEGSRLGIVVRWKAAAPGEGEVVLRRERVGAGTARTGPQAAAVPHPPLSSAVFGKAEPEAPVVMLRANDAEQEAPEKMQSNATLDTTARAGESYRYTAQRRRTVVLAGHKLRIDGEESAAATIFFQDIFPPSAPTDLTVASFVEQGKPGELPHHAVDLIWQPVDEPDLAGYNVYRQPLNGSPEGNKKDHRLNSAPVKLPAFRDTTADAATSYRYSVTAVDLNRNESGAASAQLIREAR